MGPYGFRTNSREFIWIHVDFIWISYKISFLWEFALCGLYEIFHIDCHMRSLRAIYFTSITNPTQVVLYLLVLGPSVSFRLGCDRQAGGVIGAEMVPKKNRQAIFTFKI